MAINSNDINVEQEGGGDKIYPGLAHFNVMTINPTMAKTQYQRIHNKQKSKQ